MDTDVSPEEASPEQIRDFVKFQTALFSEHMSRYLEFVRILMLLSGAIIPILLFLPQGSASLPLLIRFAAVGYLFSLICGIYCMMRLIQDPLREQLLHQRKVGKVGLSEMAREQATSWRQKRTTDEEYLWRAGQAYLFLLSSALVVLHLLFGW